MLLYRLLTHLTICRQYLDRLTWAASHIGHGSSGLNDFPSSAALANTGLLSITVDFQTSANASDAWKKFLLSRSSSIDFPDPCKWILYMSCGKTIPAKSCDKGAILRSQGLNADSPAAFVPCRSTSKFRCLKMYATQAIVSEIWESHQQNHPWRWVYIILYIVIYASGGLTFHQIGV